MTTPIATTNDELRSAAAHIRATPRCTAVHDGCDCELTDALAGWLDSVAIDDEAEPVSPARLRERAAALMVAAAVNGACHG